LLIKRLGQKDNLIYLFKSKPLLQLYFIVMFLICKKRIPKSLERVGEWFKI